MKYNKIALIICVLLISISVVQANIFDDFIEYINNIMHDITIINDANYEVVYIKELRNTTINYICNVTETIMINDTKGSYYKNITAEKDCTKNIEILTNIKPSGEIIKNNISIKNDRYFCGLDNEGIVCDEYKGFSGGGGDGNGDGICQKGETCIRY
jgi:hypothetical protein